MSAPIAPPSNPSIDLCGRISATALWFDGPRHDARVSSPRLAITRLVLTATADPELELNLLYLKGRAHLEDRVFRIETGRSFASVPMDRTTHLVGNVMVTGVENGEVAARASWIVHSYGQRGALTRGGSYEYKLRREGDGLRIARKKIVMIDDKLVGPVDIFHV